MISALLIAVFVVFVLSRVTPGNPVYLIVGSMDAGPELYERVTREMGLDRPILEQFWMYMGDLVHLDLGTARHTSNPVKVDIAARLPATIELAGAAFLLSVFPLLSILPLKKTSSLIISSGLAVCLEFLYQHLISALYYQDLEKVVAAE